MSAASTSQSHTRLCERARIRSKSRNKCESARGSALSADGAKRRSRFSLLLPRPLYHTTRTTLGSHNLKASSSRRNGLARGAPARRRLSPPLTHPPNDHTITAKKSKMNRAGFEPTHVSISELESDALDRSAICPCFSFTVSLGQSKYTVIVKPIERRADLSEGESR